MENQVPSRAPGMLEVPYDLFEHVQLVGHNHEIYFLLLVLLVHPGVNRHMSHRCGYGNICEPNEQVVGGLHAQFPSVSIPLPTFIFTFLSVDGDITSQMGRSDMVDLRAKNTARNSFLRTAS